MPDKPGPRVEDKKPDLRVESDPSVESVTQEQVYAFFEQNVERLRNLLVSAIPAIAARF